MDSHPLVESLFTRRNSKTSSQYSTAKDSDDFSLYEEHRVKIRMHLKAFTEFGWEIRLVGNIKELGYWNPQHSVVLNTNTDKYPEWQSAVLNLSVHNFPFVFEFKFVMFNPVTGEYKWESFYENRKARCKEKCSSNYLHEIFNSFGCYSIGILLYQILHNF